MGQWWAHQPNNPGQQSSGQSGIDLESFSGSEQPFISEAIPLSLDINIHAVFAIRAGPSTNTPTNPVTSPKTYN